MAFRLLSHRSLPIGDDEPQTLFYAISLNCSIGADGEHNARLRDELLNGEIFYSLKKAQIVIEDWRHHYNTKRPHSALGYRSPVPEAIVPLHERPAMN